VVLEKDGVKQPRRLGADEDVGLALRAALDAGERVVAVTPVTEKLEDLFVREVQAGDVGAGARHQQKGAAQ
jgi:hypothetical protein